MRTRRSFNGETEAENLQDAVDSTLSATKIGDAIAFTDGEAVMSGDGNSTGSLNLGTGILPGDSATIEIWATRTAIKRWSRLFDYALDTTNYLMLSWSRKTYGNTDRLTLCVDTVSHDGDDFLQFESDVKYHISLTVVANADGSTTLTHARRNLETGEIEKTGTITQSDWTLGASAQFTQVAVASSCGPTVKVLEFIICVPYVGREKRRNPAFDQNCPLRLNRF